MKITKKDSHWFACRETPKLPWLIRTEKATEKEVEQYEVVFHRSYRSIFGVWEKQHNMHCLQKLVFDPSYVGEDPLGRNLNLFCGFKARIQEKIQMEHVQPILDHIARLNNHHAPGTQYVINGLALMFQQPKEKNGTALVFNGSQGTGKNLLFDILVGQMMLGKEGHYGYVKDIESLTQQFNSIQLTATRSQLSWMRRLLVAGTRKT